MDTGVAICPNHDAIAPADMARLAERALDRYEAAVAEFNGE
jgi:hypothetical protein